MSGEGGGAQDYILIVLYWFPPGNIMYSPLQWKIERIKQQTNKQTNQTYSSTFNILQQAHCHIRRTIIIYHNIPRS